MRTTYPAAQHDKDQNDNNNNNRMTRRAGKLYRARSRKEGKEEYRLYRSQILQVNTTSKITLSKYSLESS